MSFRIAFYTDKDKYYSSETYDTYEEAEEEVAFELTNNVHFEDEEKKGLYEATIK